MRNRHPLILKSWCNVVGDVLAKEIRVMFFCAIDNHKIAKNFISID